MDRRGLSADSAGHSEEGYRPPGTNRWVAAVLMGVIVVLLLRILGQWPALWRNLPPAEPRAVTPRGDLAADEKTTIDLFREVSPSVVHVTNMAVRRDALSFNLFEIPQGTGSGFIWDAEGHIVTNYHVIQGAQSAKVTLADNSTWGAQLTGSDLTKDLVVLKIDAPPERLKPIPIGKSDDLQVGQKVFAIGNPFELDQTLTTGVISGLGREIPVAGTRRTIQGVIQTDAAINPGNSGGPLLDSAGRLIGVNTAVVDPAQGSTGGIGFAIPVDTINRVVPQLIQHGNVARAGLGILAFDGGVAARLRLEGSLSHEGVLVRDVLPGGAADKAGILPTRRDQSGEIRLGDLIMAIDGKPVFSLNDLHETLDTRKVGEEVRVTVERDGHDVTALVTLQSLGE